MENDLPVNAVDSGSTRCTGGSAQPHDPIDLSPDEWGVSTCPGCGRRYRRAKPSGRVSPANWPRDE